MDGMEWDWVLFLLCPRWMVLSFDVAVTETKAVR